MYIKDYTLEHNANSYSQELTVRFVLDKDDNISPQTLMTSKRVTIIPSEVVVKTALPEGLDCGSKVFHKVFAEQLIQAKRKESERKAAESNFSLEYEKCVRNQDKITTTKPKHGTEGNWTYDHIWDNLNSPARPSDFAQEYKSVFENPCREIMMNSPDMNMPHSLRVDGRNNKVQISGNRISAQLTVEDDFTTLRVELPGVAPERLEVKRIDDILRVRVNPLKSETVDQYGYEVGAPVKELSVLLTAEEVVTDVTLALGVLEISIDRGREIEDFKVNAE